MTLKYKKLVPEATVLPPAKNGDVGYDIITVSDPIFQDGYIQYLTGIALQIPDGYHIEIFPRSSICKYDLQLCNSIGLIDSGYTGELILRFKVPLNVTGNLPIIIANNHRNAFYITLDKCLNLPKKGDKIAQLVLRQSHVLPIEEVTELKTTERGSSGFGSTGQ